MAYSTIWLQNFRSYPEYSVELTPAVNIVVGPNGSGKTNLLEALYVASLGGSFRARDRDLLHFDSPWFRLESLFDDHKRIVKFEQSEDRLKKTFSIDGLSKQRLSHKTRLPVVLFEPDHLRLLTDSPSQRRDYLDNLLTILYPAYGRQLNNYLRVLLQRNNLLKRGHGMSMSNLRDQLFVWDIKLAELGAAIVGARVELIAQINNRIGDLYSQIAQHKHSVKLNYESAITTHEYQTSLLSRLHARLGDDIARGYTTSGPHRDDFRVVLDGADSAVSASRGETRTLLLALKIIELEQLEEHQERTPLLLLDDVFSELDSSRRRTLAELAGKYQTVITTTDADAIVKHFLSGYNVIATG